MGSAGRAIGPDGKPVKSSSGGKNTQQQLPQRGVRGGKMVKMGTPPGGGRGAPGPGMQRFGGGPGPQMNFNGGGGGPMRGPGPMGMGGRGPMGPGGPMNMGGPGGPMRGPGGPGPMGMGGPGPRGPGGPGPMDMGMGRGPGGPGPMDMGRGPGGPGGPGPMNMGGPGPARGSGPDPHGNYGFFRDVPSNQLPANRLSLTGDDRKGSKHPGGGDASSMTPSAFTVGNGGMGSGPNMGSKVGQSGPVPLMSVPVQQNMAGPNQGRNEPNVPASRAQPEPVPAPAQQAVAPAAGAPAPGDVPGFGTNSSIHELFGKMVWRKMEGLRDQAVVDRLQNRIMNLIHDALSDQNAAPPASASVTQSPVMQQQQQPMMNNVSQGGLNFRSF